MTVKDGASQTFYFIPNPGFRVSRGVGGRVLRGRGDQLYLHPRQRRSHHYRELRHQHPLDLSSGIVVQMIQDQDDDDRTHQHPDGAK